MIDPPMIRPEAVLTAYCRITGVLIADLTGPSKAAPIVKRRHELIYLLAQMTVLSQTTSVGGSATAIRRRSRRRSRM